jgi:CheY-like chemotaxis protein
MKVRHILLVEDDANDAFFIARALKDLGFIGKLHHVTTTQAARDYLSADAKIQDRKDLPSPEIVISDSALPGRTSGIELLEWLRTQRELPQPAFIMLSGEITADVRERATNAGVQSLLRKASNFNDTVRDLREALLQISETLGS